MKIKFVKDHQGYKPGEELECDAGVADAIVNWAHAATYVTPPQILPPTPRQDKMVHVRGGKSKVSTK